MHRKGVALHRSTDNSSIDTGEKAKYVGTDAFRCGAVVAGDCEFFFF